jgi:hypothetical protein
MKGYAIVFALGLGMVSHCFAEDDARRGEVELTILGPKRTIFVPAEPITVEVRVTNGSQSPIVHPGSGAWQLSLEDSSGRLLRDKAPGGPPPEYYSVPEPGEKVAISKILPGECKTWRWDLRLHFEIIRPAAYTFRCRLRGVFVPWDEKIDPRSIKQSDRFAIQAKPFEFVVSETPIFWKERRTLFVSPMITRRVTREIVLQAAKLQQECTLSFYLAGRHRRGDWYWGFQQIGKLKGKDVPPKMKDYGERRFGLRYLSPDGEKCVLIVYNGSRADWVRLDLTDEEDWPAWPDEETWRKLQHPAGEESRENTVPLEPDRHNQDEGP